MAQGFNLLSKKRCDKKQRRRRRLSIMLLNSVRSFDVEFQRWFTHIKIDDLVV